MQCRRTVAVTRREKDLFLCSEALTAYSARLLGGTKMNMERGTGGLLFLVLLITGLKFNYILVKLFMVLLNVFNLHFCVPAAGLLQKRTLLSEALRSVLRYFSCQAENES